MLIKNGTVVTEAGTLDADILLEGGVISEIGLSLQGEPELDATGCYVLPGAVDPHVHTSLRGHAAMEPLAEDLEQASRAALMGGVTTIGAYVQRIPGHSVIEMMASQIQEGEARSHVDFFLNAICLPGDEPAEVVRAGRDLGITTYKAYLAYLTKGLHLDEGPLLGLMQEVARVGGLTLVHAENGRASSYLETLEREKPVVDRGALLRTAPGIFEAEGMFRAAALARYAGSRLLFVHLSSAEGTDVLAYLRDRGGQEAIECETQPHYLCLTNDEVLRRGPLGKVGPPLKEERDVDAVWRAIRTGLVSHVSSDHSPRTRAMKEVTDNILDAPYGGISGVEVLLPLTHHLAVDRHGLPIVELSRLVATNAAKRYGIYPRKGTIQPGSDADLVILPKEGREVSIEPTNLHGASDYTLYEGFQSRVFPQYVLRKGSIAVRDGELADNPSANYLARGTG